ncbi:MAG TPA: DUF72 domain-containing protein [Acidobacteriota bacterium]|nr:DUF72 domain-containing protein [Acidobacteriota bacterium]
MTPQIRIGTSGWHYKHWYDRFYPAHLPPARMLSFYADHFDTVEINNTFYHLPAKSTLREWRKTAPENFCFAVKASRYLTHMKKLKSPAAGLKKFFSHTDILKETLGPVLFQLPPRWHCNIERLSDFLQALPARHRYSFEFRDSSWLVPAVFDLLARHKAALCIYDLAGFRSPVEVTADFVYVRLHGTTSVYQGDYPKASLRAWATRIESWHRLKDIYFYFNNDAGGYAVANAMELRRML